MPLNLPSAQALPGNFSGSSRRSHAEITKSESRSQSPLPPTKRRRTDFTPSPPTMSSNSGSTDYYSPIRYSGDGLDFRRPIMSVPSTSTSTSQPHNQDTIDLTLDDDTPPRAVPTTEPLRASVLNNNTSMRSSNGPTTSRAPPFLPNNNVQAQSVIDLSSDDEEYTRPADNGGTRIDIASPEVEFMGERTLPRPAGADNLPRRRPHLPTPPGMAGMGQFVNFVRGMTQNYFGNLGAGGELPEETLNRIDGLLNHPAMGTGGLEQPPQAFLDEYDGLQMDYGRTAFNIGGDLLLIEDPQLPDPLPGRGQQSAYKEPPPAREGFTKNYEEDDMLICGFCGDELATGPTEQKQQVWIIKQCGHAYCGECAHNRNISKNKNNRDTKRAASKKTNAFRACTVPDCRKTVDSKTKMFQIYL